MTKYRFRFEDFDAYVIKDNKIISKDDMIWVFDNLVVGISTTHEYHVINHYNKDFDLSEYVRVDDAYNSNDFCDEWWDHTIKVMEPSLKKHREKINNV